MQSRVTPVMPVKPTASFLEQSCEAAFRKTQSIVAGKGVGEVPGKQINPKSPFAHPKSAPVRAEDFDNKKQHFVFLGNLMAAPEAREVVLARQKQYYDDLSRQVLEKQKLKTRGNDLDHSMKLDVELQALNEELRQARAIPDLPCPRFRKKHEIENHLNLQIHGSSFYGGVLQRDEVALIRKKKEEQQREIQEALKKQIEEKTAKKLAEKQARIKQEVAEGQLFVEEQKKTTVTQSTAEPTSPSRPTSILLPTDSDPLKNSTPSPVASPSSQVAPGFSDLELLNAKVEEMQRNNQQLMERIKEQHEIIAQIQDQKPQGRPKPQGRLKPRMKVALPESPGLRKTSNVMTKPDAPPRRKDPSKARQTSTVFHQSTLALQTPPSPLVIPRMQSAFAGGGVSPLIGRAEESPGLSAPKVASSRVFFASMGRIQGKETEGDGRENLDTAGESKFIYPTQEGGFYPVGKDELDKLIESENRKLTKSPSIPELHQTNSQWVPISNLDTMGHRSQMSYVPTTDGETKVSRFPRDVFATIGRKRP